MKTILLVGAALVGGVCLGQAVGWHMTGFTHLDGSRSVIEVTNNHHRIVCIESVTGTMQSRSVGVGCVEVKD